MSKGCTQSDYGNIRIFIGRHFGKMLLWLIFLIIAISLGAGIFLIYDITYYEKFPSVYKSNIAVYIFLSIMVVVDLIISLMMCYYLRKSRAAMNFSTPLTPLLLHIMRLILVSGLATSVCSLLTLIACIVWPKSSIFIAIDFMLPKLYINSILAMWIVFLYCSSPEAHLH
ncbi:uncharacterized protein ARMOST_18878 [Armillaria ostoyae]|uniref:DUF6534 domain-containing protein n=1 Tax=Armillaria ostoyae TaxID=47428 RepID=A0A284S2Z1_ARMOS|nr:uncharacterized protein ARMOST_18878 [Armillaria ostoyae]